MRAYHKVTKRKISLDDVEAVAELHESQNERPADRAYIRECISNFPSSACFSGQRMIGFAYTASFAPDILNLTNLLVDDDHRGRGVGTLLLADVEEQARAGWAGLILTNSELLHRPSRPSPLPFYAKHGYSILFQTEHTSVLIKRLC